MEAGKTILIAGGANTYRKELRAILADRYVITEIPENNKVLKVLEERDDIVTVLLGISSRRNDDIKLVEDYMYSGRFKNLPLIIFSPDEDDDVEAKCIKLGAWDYLWQPYDADVVRLRIENALERREFHILKALRERERIDNLTGIYKKEQFIEDTRKIIDEHEKGELAIIHFDIYKFHMFNTVYGKEDGDKLIKYIAGLFKGIAKFRKPTTYCHEDADIFYICTRYEDKDELVRFFASIRKELNLYRKDYDLLPSFGVYVIQDKSVSVQELMGLARFASKSCKGSYIQNYAFYTKEMSDNVMKEQFVLNNMNTALEKEQFILYLQPKYELLSNTIQGAEVLVRWDNPEKGMISPGDFIPVFEKNGFITALDFYVWEHSCQMIHKWIIEGRTPCPISVNVSRISLYNPQLADVIGNLVKKYEVPPMLLQLELTESAYTDNPKMIKDTMAKLHEMGFTILMDDFGSGYSSLNVLKDIAVDILKIDMKFMEKGDVPGRSENILASVVRMAKWLNMPVVAEGVETADQAKFLRSIGCEYVQGYYFARPMPLENYEARAFGETIFKEDEKDKVNEGDTLWISNDQIETLFANILQPVAILEYDGEYDVEAIKVNNAYYEAFGFDSLARHNKTSLQYMDSEGQQAVVNAFKSIIKNHGVSECEYYTKLQSGRKTWLDMRLKYIGKVGERYIIFATFTDITAGKEIDKELQRYKKAVELVNKERPTIMIVDDLELNRSVLRGIFETKYEIIEVVDGQKALDKIKELNYDIDIILLDLNMPVMDGETFLKYKAQDDEMNHIPVVIISCNDSTQTQVQTLASGVVSDYIVKPFVPEVVLHRVANVLDSNRKIIDALRRK